VFFNCLKHYSYLLLIPEIVEYAWVPSSRRQKETLATATSTPPQLPPSLSLHTLHHFHHPSRSLIGVTLFALNYSSTMVQKISHIFTVSSFNVKKKQ